LNVDIWLAGEGKMTLDLGALSTGKGLWPCHWSWALKAERGQKLGGFAGGDARKDDAVIGTEEAK
jgi:hypothetical protein